MYHVHVHTHTLSIYVCITIAFADAAMDPLDFPIAPSGITKPT